ncbi:type II secretion system ATPase GspE [Brevundimonas sp.]|uniref:type II secretion system ATPase GspE n=1 Tax=Brevundimonas sp. TaxID=1871086 RepID=UPI002896B707|nr:type II secretion system ATPase GspE [Brevundimonas sp.]
MITLADPKLPYGFARTQGVVLLMPGDVMAVGARRDVNPLALVEARRLLGRPLSVEMLDDAQFERRLSDIYASDALSSDRGDELDIPSGLEGLVEEMPAAEDLLDSHDDAPVIRLINGVIAEAVRLGASDIHLETFESRLLVRMRVDGVLREALSLNPRMAPLLVSRIKVMARLDIAEKRVPQDGRIALMLGGRNLDVRVSTLPSRGGERVVMRVLDRDRTGVDFDSLGMAADARAALERALAEPHGVILVTGPTGSGKTTSLYAGLSRLNDGQRNILTIEDPVEYAVEGIGQTQVNTRVGMTFAAGLRAILRQDPDVVMVGEIRDTETASIAVQASLTGHLVLSTVHTNDAAGAITRLRDMGVEPFLLASSVRLIMAQRLVRKLCPHCRAEETLDAVTAARIGLKARTRHFRPVGCSHCAQTGYVGRLGVYEVMPVDETVRRLIATSAPEEELVAAAFGPKGEGLLADRVRIMVQTGQTSVEEAVRVTGERSGQADD